MSTWTKQKIGSFAKVKGGKRLPKGFLVQDEKTDFPYIRVTDMTSGRINREQVKFIKPEAQKSIARYTISADDVYISIAGTIGMVGKIPRELDGANLTENAAKITDFTDKFDGNFLFYYLSSREGQFQIKQRIGGSTQPKLALNRIQTIEIPSPELSIQVRIASVLSVYDDLIENNEGRLKVLEKMAQLLYTEWFVKFKFPGHEKAKFINSETSFGRIPYGWEVKKLSDVAQVIRGCSYSSEEIDDFAGEYYIVNLKSFNRGGGFRFDGAKYYSGGINDSQNLTTGDIVVAVTDMTNDRAVIARPARVPEIGGKITFSADVVKIDSDILPNSFLYELLSSYKFTETTKQMANGANVLHLKPSAILEFVTLVPDKELLDKFEALCKSAATETNKLLKANDNLSKTRDLLIPQLITGKRALKENVVSLNQIIQPKDVFKDAVIFSYYVSKASTQTFYPTHLRAVKSVYFANRFCGADPVLQYAEDRFGPYNSKNTYAGGESVAIKKKYVERIKGGFKSGVNVNEVNNYSYKELSAVDKVLSFLKYKKDTELELLATVDYILYKMLKNGEKPAADSVYEYIEQSQVWKQKVDRLQLSVDKISEAMNILRGLVEEGLVYPAI